MQVKMSLQSYVEQKLADPVPHPTSQYFPLFNEESLEKLVPLWDDKWEMFHNPLHALSYVLDPEYFCCQDLQCDPYLTTEIRKALKALYPNPEERADIEAEIHLMRSKFRLDPDFEILGSKVPAHTLWADTYINKTLMPLAKRLLSQVCSSSACERCWSNYSFIHSDRR
jgi:hypothetical protein